AIGVFKPGNFRSPGRVPDAQLVLSHAGKALEDYALLSELGNNLVDGRNLPAQDGETSRRKVLDLSDTQHSPINVEDQGKAVLAYELEPQLILLKRFRLGGILCGDEGHHLVKSDHA